jgi:hypothetical protein
MARGTRARARMRVLTIARSDCDSGRLRLGAVIVVTPVVQAHAERRPNTPLSHR